MPCARILFHPISRFASVERNGRHKDKAGQEVHGGGESTCLAFWLRETLRVSDRMLECRRTSLFGANTREPPRGASCVLSAAGTANKMQVDYGSRGRGAIATGPWDPGLASARPGWSQAITQQHKVEVKSCAEVVTVATNPWFFPLARTTHLQAVSESVEFCGNFSTKAPKRRSRQYGACSNCQRRDWLSHRMATCIFRMGPRERGKGRGGLIVKFPD